MDSSLRNLLRQTCKLARFVENNVYGEAQFGVAKSYPCRTISKTQMVRDATGSEMVSSSTTWLGPSVKITTQDQITLPDGSQPQIIQIQSYPSVNGATHHKVIFT